MAKFGRIGNQQNLFCFSTVRRFRRLHAIKSVIVSAIYRIILPAQTCGRFSTARYGAGVN
jgi:hypothetical protein